MLKIVGKSTILRLLRLESITGSYHYLLGLKGVQQAGGKMAGSLAAKLRYAKTGCGVEKSAPPQQMHRSGTAALAVERAHLPTETPSYAAMLPLLLLNITRKRRGASKKMLETNTLA
jgi:hypothetical protein